MLIIRRSNSPDFQRLSIVFRVMRIVDTVSELRDAVRTWRSAGQSVALVPTMGNLHAGHLTLVNEAQKKGGSGGGQYFCQSYSVRRR